MLLYLHNRIKKYFSASADLFSQVMALRGECFRHQKGRLTQRVSLGGESYFLKQHTGVGWQEILKNICQGRLPVISARNEWLAIEKLRSIGLAVPFIAGYGSRGINPARIQSFILMAEIAPAISLEELCADWLQVPPLFADKNKLLIKVAHITRAMHGAGINHRDLYICHFLLQAEALYLIDLHRAQIRPTVPERWRVKDLAGLYFSSKDIGLTNHDLLRFMREYSGMSLREIFRTSHQYWHKVKERGE